MLLNLVILYCIFGIALLPSKQKGHFIIVLIAIIQLLKTSIILFFNTVVLFKYNLTYMHF